jgi:acetate---CoA ligase (ADP-forming)
MHINHSLLKPRSVAILGASERPSLGQLIMESLSRIGFPGAVYPVNPKYETVFGHRCYASIAELPAGVDVLALFYAELSPCAVRARPGSRLGCRRAQQR